MILIIENVIEKKIENCKKHYMRKRRESDTKFKLICNKRTRTNKAFMCQKIKKTNKTFDLLGCSPEFFRRWIIHQLYGDMTIESHGFTWQIDCCLSIASFNLLDETDMKKCFNWVNLRPMYSTENKNRGLKLIIDYIYSNR